MLRDSLTVLAAFLLGTAVSALLGASSLGVALTFGQIAFAGTLTWVLLRR
ncbi:MAG: hypothetical protein F2799_03600 [Actinobacteria bacterium]|uniref:Unannotated protein n=1 Tax=freshwater metagenome TaxID=449393 RepID=A0A6J7DQD4_9ZZZZ|nr:hypothetical protein [Actinomycetota bacterium]